MDCIDCRVLAQSYTYIINKTLDSIIIGIIVLLQNIGENYQQITYLQKKDYFTIV